MMVEKDFKGPERQVVHTYSGGYMEHGAIGSS